MIENGNEGLDALACELAWRRSGWHRHVNEEPGAMAIFPETAKNGQAWEQKAALQTVEAEELERATRPEAKPLENTLARRVQRGD